MLPIPRRHAHYVFGLIQSGLTTLIASGVGSLALWGTGAFLGNWMTAWLASWAAMLPVVILAAPVIRRMAEALTRAEA
jgi:hypothetical protein